MLLARVLPPPHDGPATLIAKVDSARVVVWSDSLHPHVVRLLTEHKGAVERFLTNPAFSVAWPMITGIIAFFIGRWWQDRDRKQRKRDEQWTSARLTRRYLISSAKQIRALVERLTSDELVLAQAHVDYVRRAISDFDEIKARMIALENDALEEKIFQWNLVCWDNLKELNDALTMSPDVYRHTYGITTVELARYAAIAATLAVDADNAFEIVTLLEPYIGLRVSDSRRGG
jgi:hypothetical protein